MRKHEQLKNVMFSVDKGEISKNENCKKEYNRQFKMGLK